MTEPKREHIAWSCNGNYDDCRAAWCEKHHGKLFLCTVCNQAEAELEKFCPGPIRALAVDWKASIDPDGKVDVGYELREVEPVRCAALDSAEERCILPQGHAGWHRLSLLDDDGIK